MELQNVQKLHVIEQVLSVKKISNWESWSNLTIKSDWEHFSEESSFLNC